MGFSADDLDFLRHQKNGCTKNWSWNIFMWKMAAIKCAIKVWKMATFLKVQSDFHSTAFAGLFF